MQSKIVQQSQMAWQQKEKRTGRTPGKPGPAREKERRCRSQGKKEKFVVAGSKCKGASGDFYTLWPLDGNAEQVTLVVSVSPAETSQPKMLCEANHSVRRIAALSALGETCVSVAAEVKFVSQIAGDSDAWI